MNKKIHTLAKTALILTYLVIIAGAVVRMTGSGMGCPDWPKCFGYLIPPTEQSQLKFHPNREYKKGQIIVYNEGLQVAKEDFISADTLSIENWELYTKHSYAVFNPVHTWVEYINRLFGALAGFSTLILAIASLWYYKRNKIITFLSWIVVFAMGFQAWLGKTVVDSHLAPYKITVHMLMALVIVAFILYLVFKTREQQPVANVSGIFKTLLLASFILSLIQIGIGTQVRHFVDEQIRVFNEQNKALWLNEDALSFYIHRSFSFLVIAVNLALFYIYKKQKLPFHKVNWILILIALEVISGILMAYFSFPFGMQTLHLVVASLLFGINFYIILEVYNRQPLYNKKS